MKLLNILAGCLAAMALLVPGPAEAKLNLDKYHAEIIDKSVDDNLAHPEVPKKLIPAVSDHMVKVAMDLKKAGFDNVDQTERSGMVVMITMPAAELFVPNDTVIRPEATLKMLALAKKLKVADRYKLLVTVHSDDTGSEEYLNQLTKARSEAIVDWLGKQGVDSAGVVPYGLGYDEPISTERSRAARAANRRIELYIVPGPVLLEELKAAN